VRLTELNTPAVFFPLFRFSQRSLFWGNIPIMYVMGDIYNRYNIGKHTWERKEEEGILEMLARFRQIVKS
jgi:hypothetical protein